MLLSVYVEDPEIFGGIDDGYGHDGYHNNCVTHARDAWHFYSKELYPLSTFHTPKSLCEQVLARHPDLN
jgi:hypothetical protein